MIVILKLIGILNYIEAGNNINIQAGNQMITETGANYEIKVGVDGKITAGTSNIKSKHYETADRIDMNGPRVPSRIRIKLN